MEHRGARSGALACRPADDPRYDPQLLRDGDARNVVDAYRYWTREAIIADIDRRRHRLHVRSRISAMTPTSRRRPHRERVRCRHGAHRRAQALESPRRHGHRPLPTADHHDSTEAAAGFRR